MVVWLLQCPLNWEPVVFAFLLLRCNTNVLVLLLRPTVIILLLLLLLPLLLLLLNCPSESIWFGGRRRGLVVLWRRVILRSL
jgi:hypothetical protein